MDDKITVMIEADEDGDLIFSLWGKEFEGVPRMIFYKENGGGTELFDRGRAFIENRRELQGFIALLQKIEGEME